MAAPIARAVAALRGVVLPILGSPAPRPRRRRRHPSGWGGADTVPPRGRPTAAVSVARAAQVLPGWADRHQRELEAAVPEVLDVLRATIAAGVAPIRALQAAAEAAPSTLAPILAGAVRSTELGSGAGRALADAAREEGLNELVLAGEALDLAEATGAPAGRMLAGVAAAAADRVRGRQARLAATAEARLSARVVAGMAPSFLVVLSLTAPEDAVFLVRSPAGWATLAAAAVFETLGVWWASRIVAGTATPPARPRRRAGVPGTSQPPPTQVERRATPVTGASTPPSPGLRSSGRSARSRTGSPESTRRSAGSQGRSAGHKRGSAGSRGRSSGYLGRSAGHRRGSAGSRGGSVRSSGRLPRARRRLAPSRRRSVRSRQARTARGGSPRSRRTLPTGGAALACGAALAGGLAFVAGPALLLALSLAAGAVLVAVRLAQRRGLGRSRAELSEAAPAVIDLLGACLLAGLNPYLALQRVAERSPEALRAELAQVAAELELGRTPAAALRAAADRTSLGELRAAAGVLAAAERWGTPPAEALAARAEALRTRARLQAEAEAGRAAVRLAFPLVFCFLPAFVLLVVLPTVAGALRALTP
jgi:Flp pilus assembly protein TadB